MGRNRRVYSNSELCLGNLAIVIWIILGAGSCTLFYLFAAFPFLAVSAYLIFYELGKHGCVTCYYCETCTIGMGKLPELFFRKAGTSNANRRAQRLFPFTYLLLSALPITLVVVSLFQEIAMYKLALMVAVLTFSLYVGIIRRQIILRSLRI